MVLIKDVFKTLWFNAFLWAICLFIVTFLDILIRTSYLLLPICIPWMHDYLAIIVLSLCISVYIKWFKHSTKNFLSLCFEFFCKFFVSYVVIASIIVLPNQYFSSGEEIKKTGTVIDNEMGIYVPSKQADSWVYYSKIYIKDLGMSFWYQSGKIPQSVGRNCVVIIRKGLWGIRYAQKVDFIVD